MKILVTGGAGFIGSHVVDRYLALGHQVVVVDNLSTGKEENLNPRAKFYKLDIRDPELRAVFKEEQPRIVNHHAAQMDIAKSTADPVFDAEVNIIGSLNIMNYCKEFNAAKLIFVSSGGAVYGEPRALPVAEEHPCQPASPYGVSKLCVEKYLFAVAAYQPYDYVILRYANVYGPRQNPHGEAGVSAIFINKLLRDLTCVLYGYGEAVRDYVFVEDIVNINEIVLTKGSKTAYNLGTGRGAKVSEIYDLLRTIIGSPKEPEYKPLRQGELQGIYLNCDKARKELGWSARVTLEDGLRRTVDSFR